MSSIVSYLRIKIQKNMEDPAERERKWEERLRGRQAAAVAVKANMSHPTKAWGFWRSAKQSAKYEELVSADLAKQPGRTKPL